MIQARVLDGCAGVRHGFFTRRGGVSKGVFASLNCGYGSGDARERVAANRGLAMARFGLAGDDLVTAHQVHSASAVVVESAWPPEGAPTGDAMATRVPGLALGVLSADCAPVLFADGEAGVIGVAHAGWRGARAGVLEAAVDAMVSLGARPGAIVAGVGPCIHQASYEVGPEFRARFDGGRPAASDLFVPSEREGHFLFDLPAYVRRRLETLALAAVEELPFDTCADGEQFFSYRRDARDGHQAYGRGLATIALVA